MPSSSDERCDPSLRTAVLQLIADSLSETLVTEVTLDVIPMETSLADSRIDGWLLDSLDVISMIVALEAEFDCDLEPVLGELTSRTRWEQFVDAVAEVVERTRAA